MKGRFLQRGNTAPDLVEGIPSLSHSAEWKQKRGGRCIRS